MIPSWLQANWLNVALILAAIGAVSGWTSSARYRGMADAEAAAKVRAMRQAETNADSASEARARALRATREAEAEREHYQATLARLNARLTDLSASHDSLEAAAEREIQAHDGWLSRETHERVVDNLERSLLLTDSLRVEAEALARTEKKRGDALQVQVGALAAQIGSLETVVQTQEREIVALRAANSSRSLWPDFGGFTKPVYIAIGAVIGYGVAEVTR